MRHSLEIIKKYSEETLPDIPGLEKETELRAALALYTDLTIFSDNNEDKAKEAIPEIFEYFQINSENEKKRVLSFFENKREILKFLLLRLYSDTAPGTTKKGRFSYPLSDNFIYFDENAEKWNVNLNNLYKYELKYDGINPINGQVIVVFNPYKKDSKITVDNTGMDIRTEYDEDLSYDEDDETGDEELPDYDAWDKLLSEADDRSIVVIYHNGEETMRL